MNAEIIISNENLDECYSLMIELIKRAGTLAIEGYNSNVLIVSTKQTEHDLVTNYDRAIERIFIDEITLKFPNHK